MPSRDFAVRVYGERLTPEMRAAIGVLGSLVLYIAAKADARSNTVFVNLEEFAVWAGCAYSSARRAWDEAERLKLVVDVKRRAHGFVAGLGEMYQHGQSEELTAAVRVYERVHRRRPGSVERESITRAVGTGTAELVTWRRVCEEWHGNPADTEAMVQVFERRRVGARVLGATNDDRRPAKDGGRTEPPGLRD